MNIKELLLEGCMISYSYKEKVTEWVGEAKIHIFAGYFSKPKIIFECYSEIGGRKEWDIDKLDEAIERFENVVFNKKNLMYKVNETVRELSLTGKDVDLDDEEDYLIVRNIINKKLEEKEK